METTRFEYQKRLNEIEIYFDTLSLLDKGRCRIECVDISLNTTSKEIDLKLSKILKANGFILLYNLIEATIRNSISAIFNIIRAERLSFADLSDKMRKLWIRQEIKKSNEANRYDRVSEIASVILNNELLCFQHDCINISGNIDAQEIRNIAKQFGYLEPTDGSKLLTIKEKRNKQAHGEFTFCDIGKDYTVRELNEFKEETIHFLENVLTNIGYFIDNKQYKHV